MIILNEGYSNDAINLSHTYRLGLGFGPGGQKCSCGATVGVAGGDLHHFLQQAVIEGGGVEAQLDEAAVVHNQVVFNGLVAGLGRLLT